MHKQQPAVDKWMDRWMDDDDDCDDDDDSVLPPSLVLRTQLIHYVHVHDMQ